MIARVWRGWTSPENADEYEALLRTTIFPGIEARDLAGYRGIELWREDQGDRVAFVTVMRFDTPEAIEGFVGEDSTRAYVPPAARRLLSRFDDRSRHYEVRETRASKSTAGAQQ